MFTWNKMEKNFNKHILDRTNEMSPPPHTHTCTSARAHIHTVMYPTSVVLWVNVSILLIPTLYALSQLQSQHLLTHILTNFCSSHQRSLLLSDGNMTQPSCTTTTIQIKPIIDSKIKSNNYKQK